MLITKKMLLVLTLVGVLVGAGVGTLITRSASSNTAATNSTEATPAANTAATWNAPAQSEADRSLQFKTAEEQAAYRAGVMDGCSTAQDSRRNSTSPTAAAYRAPVRRLANGRRVYYDYSNQPRGRSFWQKHRDKLTVAMGTGGGALLGGLIGGKKGAGIGALAGAGGSALYTYKIRKRTRRY
jgi:hypothetical protein